MSDFKNLFQDLYTLNDENKHEETVNKFLKF